MDLKKLAPWPSNTGSVFFIKHEVLRYRRAAIRRKPSSCLVTGGAGRLFRTGPGKMAQVLRTLEIWGDPQERGRRHGQTLGGDIRLLRRAILTYLARISLYAGALPLYGLLQWLARGFWPYIPPHLQQEMAALAAGAEVSLGSILLLNGVDDLANNSPRCSALAVGTAHTAQGDYLMGRNLDYPVFTEYLAESPDPVSHFAASGSAPGLPGLAGICGGVHRHQRLRGGPGPALGHEPGPHPQGDPGGPALQAGPGRRGHGGRGGRPRPQSARHHRQQSHALRAPGSPGAGDLGPAGGGAPSPPRVAHHHQPLSKPGHAGTERALSSPPPLFRALRLSFHRGLQPGPEPAGSRSWPQTAAWVPWTYKKFSPTPASPMPAPRSAPCFTPPTGSCGWPRERPPR